MGSNLQRKSRTLSADSGDPDDCQGKRGNCRTVAAERSGDLCPQAALTQSLLESIKQVFDSLEEKFDAHRLVASLTEMRYVLENDSKLMSTLVSHLRMIAQQRQLFDETDSLRLATALNEAFENAHYHGNLEVSSSLREESLCVYFDLARSRREEAPYRDRRVHVRVLFSDDAVELQIRDEGPGFDLSLIPDPTDLSWLERPHGRGILLMAHICR